MKNPSLQPAYILPAGIRILEKALDFQVIRLAASL